MYKCGEFLHSLKPKESIHFFEVFPILGLAYKIWQPLSVFGVLVSYVKWDSYQAALPQFLDPNIHNHWNVECLLITHKILVFDLPIRNLCRYCQSFVGSCCVCYYVFSMFISKAFKAFKHLDIIQKNSLCNFNILTIEIESHFFDFPKS